MVDTVYNIVCDEDLEGHIQYNKDFRFGCAFYVDGKRVYNGYIRDERLAEYDKIVEVLTVFKDKSSKHADNINAGLFTYPSLMAGDILLYQADLVPTGEDQKQHVELTRDLAERFNKIYGDTFKIPKPYIPKVGARIMGLQDPRSKMSKSSTIPNDTILLVDTPEEILKKVKKAVTDSDGIVKYDEENKPGISNLMEIYSIITGKTFEEIEKEFEGSGYGIFKVAVAEAIIKELEPFHNKYNELMANPEYLEEIYNKGAEKARRVASKTVESVYEKIGLIR